MKKFDVDVVYTFHGWCQVVAKSQEEAEEIARQNMTACRPTIEDNGCDKINDFSCDTMADTETF